MDELKQLQQWQRLHEQQITRKQRQLVDGLNQPNAKPIAIVSDHFDRCHTLEDSVEQIRGEDNSESDDSLTTSRQSFSRTSYSESSPVMPGIDGNKIKTFEELLDNRLSGLKSDDSDKKDKPMPVKPFLKKGEGLKRFNPNKCPLKDETKPKSVANDNQPTKRQKKQNVRFKGYIPKKKLTKSDSAESVNYKKFMRKVIPLTTKLSKSDQTRVEVTRNTPTFVKGETEKETDLIDYLMQVYQNLSLSESDDIDDLQELLHKIESKERHIERQSLDNEKVLDSNLSGDYTSDDNSKKKVRWSPDTQVIASDDSDQEMVGSLIQPKAGAYSCKLKKQITELEEKLLTLRNTKNKMSDKNVPQTLELGESIADELSKLREQIEKLNKRIVNMEAKSYDLLSDRKNGSSQPSQQMKCIFGQRLVTTSKSKPKNISVNETPTQTTIDFPNGDKMSVSKDNTIVSLVDGLFFDRLIDSIVFIHKVLQFWQRNHSDNISGWTKNN